MNRTLQDIVNKERELYWPAQAVAVAKKLEVTRRQAKPATCRRCGANILIGDDHDRASLIATVNAAPVTHLEEVVAILQGSGSYDLDHGNLYYREPWHTAKPSIHSVHITHECKREG